MALIKHHLSALVVFALVFAAFPTRTNAEDNPAPKKISPFGIGADSRTSAYPEKWLPQMAEAGIRTLRTCRMSWGAIEPEEGQFTFEEFDRQLAQAEQLGIVTGGMFLGTPKYNTKDKRGSLPLNNIDAWKNYVIRTVKHANGQVKYWEVWNEAPNFTNNAPPEDYAKIVVATYDAVKAADPTALVGIAVKSVDINYLDRAIRAGAKGHFDYVTLHPYETLGFVIDDPDAEPVFMNIVPTVRKMLAELDPEKTDCPIWITELGSNAKRKGEDIQAQALVKAFAMSIAQGIETVTWFEGMDGDSGPMGLLKADGTPRPAYIAMKQMTTYLGSYPDYLGWLKLNQTNYGFVFKGAEDKISLIAWAPKGKTDQIDFGLPVKVVDPFTGAVSKTAKFELTNTPVIVVDPPENLVAEAQQNKSKRMTWGEDYSDARSVSITMEEKTLEKGLHTRAGDSLAADVLDYGGSARAGNAPKGNVYMVDPAFLSYTTVPIEITAEVRRNPANAPAKLTLEYESTMGLKKAKPFLIPDNTKWHQATWRIDDAQFVGKYGFNFRFDPGKFYIRSVTVTKVEND